MAPSLSRTSVASMRPSALPAVRRSATTRCSVSRPSAVRAVTWSARTSISSTAPSPLRTSRSPRWSRTLIAPSPVWAVKRARRPLASTAPSSPLTSTRAPGGTVSRTSCSTPPIMTCVPPSPGKLTRTPSAVCSSAIARHVPADPAEAAHPLDHPHAWSVPATITTRDVLDVDHDVGAGPVGEAAVERG